MKPLLDLSHYSAIKINGQWYACRRLVLDSENASGLVGAGITGGKVTLGYVWLPSTEAQAIDAMRGGFGPALVFDGPVFVDGALVNVRNGGLANSGGWLGTVRQEAVVKERCCKLDVWYDSETGRELRRTVDWYDEAGTISFWFDALGIQTDSVGAPAIRISNAREQSVASSVQECKDNDLLGWNSQRILDGGWTGFYLDWPAWDLLTTVNAGYGDGPFYRPMHMTLKASGLPISTLDGGGGGGGIDRHYSYTYRFAYYYSVSFNCFGPESGTEFCSINRFDAPGS